MHRTTAPLTVCRVPRSAHLTAPVRVLTGGPSGNREFGVVTDRVAVQPLLLDDLVGAGGTQLVWPISGTHQQRHTRTISFQHRRVEIRRRGSRGAYQRGSSARSRGDPQCNETCAAVEIDV